MSERNWQNFAKVGLQLKLA